MSFINPRPLIPSPPQRRAGVWHLPGPSRPGTRQLPGAAGRQHSIFLPALRADFVIAPAAPSGFTGLWSLMGSRKRGTGPGEKGPLNLDIVSRTPPSEMRGSSRRSTIPGPGCRIRIIDKIEDPENDNADVQVELIPTGKRWIATFFTPDSLKTYFERNPEDPYFWNRSFVVVPRLTPVSIRQAIEAILRDNLLDTIFEPVTDKT